MRIDEAILIMENERPHCGDKLTFTEEERYEAYTWAIGALKELSSAQLEERTKERTKKRTETHACDLISRNAALALVVKAIHGTDSEEIKDYLFGGLRKKLWALPSAQPEIIRCKDCKYYIDNRCYKIKALDDLRGSNDYCSYAERRADE